MKTLKFDHQHALAIVAGTKTTTWRMFDAQELSANDEVRVLDKVDPARQETWKVIGTAHVNQVIEKLVRDLTLDDLVEHGYGSIEEVMAAFTERHKINVGLTTPIKIVYFSFKPAIHGDVFDATHDVTSVKLYTDGGSRGNPGPSACGYVVMDAKTDAVLADKSVYLGITNNNQAEYLALKMGLEEARTMGARTVEVYMDSLLVVNQMNGLFGIKNRDLWPIHEAIKALVGSFNKVTFQHVPREQNILADAAVNRALDGHLEVM